MLTDDIHSSFCQRTTSDRMEEKIKLFFAFRIRKLFKFFNSSHVKIGSEKGETRNGKRKVISSLNPLYHTS
jgi:hypothetical protein